MGVAEKNKPSPVCLAGDADWGMMEMGGDEMHPKNNLLGRRSLEMEGDGAFMLPTFALSIAVHFEIWRTHPSEQPPTTNNGTTMSSSSGSWQSGCPEKYPWIGGEERLPPGMSRRCRTTLRKAQTIEVLSWRITHPWRRFRRPRRTLVFNS